MTVIKPIGNVLHVDDDGYLVSESSLDKIHEPWLSAVRALKDAYLKHIQLHSLYVRGTVARGNGMPNISDIDSLALVDLTEEEINGLDLSWMSEENNALRQQFPFVERFEFCLVSLKELFTNDNYLTDRFVIKTQSACIYGDSIISQIEPFKITDDLAETFYQHIGRRIEGVRNTFASDPSPDIIRRRCRWIMKRLLRAGMALVMVREQAYTRDLYPSYELFSKYYPEYEAEMRQALQLALDPTDDKAVIEETLKTLGEWMIQEVNQRINKKG